jgi:hypothetical protein
MHDRQKQILTALLRRQKQVVLDSILTRIARGLPCSRPYVTAESTVIHQFRPGTKLGCLKIAF